MSTHTTNLATMQYKNTSADLHPILSHTLADTHVPKPTLEDKEIKESETGERSRRLM